MSSQRPLKILFTEHANAYGGQERYIHRLMLKLRENGHHVEALCMPNAELVSHLRDDGFEVHTVDIRKGIRGWPAVFSMRKLMRNKAYDVVNTNSRQDTILAGLAARLARIPLIVRTRHLAKPIGSLLSYNIIPHRVITPSQFVRQMLINKGVMPEHIDVIGPPVNLPKPLPEPILRKELNLDKSAIIVGSVAVLRKEKHMDELIEAMAPLIKQHRLLHLVIVGDGQALNNLKQQVQDLDIDAQVHLLGRRNDVPALLGDFDVFALASHTEAAGTVFAEAGAAKLPTVGYEVTGIPEMIKPGVSGFLVPLQDISAFRKALEKLITSPELRSQMGEAGYQFVIDDERFTLDKVGKLTINSYRRWLEQLIK